MSTKELWAEDEARDTVPEEPTHTVQAPPIPRYGHPMFYEILHSLADLHSRKNHDYAGGEDPFRNFRMCEAAGIPAWKGAVVRLTDKMSRVLTFAKKESYEVKDESVEDTLCDAAVYSIITLILYRESREKAA